VRREAWSAVRTAIDGGVPAWGFHMHIPENYLIYGYDSHGYYFRGDDCPGGFGPKSWEAVATDEPGWFEMHTLAPASPAPVEEAVFAALEYAIAMRDSSETFRHGGFVFGHDAYGQWQRTLSADEADWMGIAYNARAWSVARRNAERFLGEVEEYVPGSCSEALGRAQEEFEAVARSWEEVSDLFPYDDTERWERIANWQDDERRESARRLLSNAAKAEVRGTAWIEKVLELWDSAGGDGE